MTALIEVTAAVWGFRGLLALGRSQRRRRTDDFGTTQWLRTALVEHVDARTSPTVAAELAERVALQRAAKSR